MWILRLMEGGARGVRRVCEVKLIWFVLVRFAQRRGVKARLRPKDANSDLTGGRVLFRGTLHLMGIHEKKSAP